MGIDRPVRKRAQGLPITDVHRQVLAALDDGPRWTHEVRRATGLSAGTVTSALYVLASRGLVMHLGYGKPWAQSRQPEA
jgi:predicted transcriptional regulator